MNGAVHVLNGERTIRRTSGVRTVPCALLVTSLGLATLQGCAAHRPAAEPAYETVADGPGRDARTAEQHHARAARLIAEGEWDQAEAALKAALAADVMYGPAHNNLGKVYFHQGKLYLAAWEFQYAAKLMPNPP